MKAKQKNKTKKSKIISAICLSVLAANVAFVGYASVNYSTSSLVNRNLKNSATEAGIDFKSRLPFELHNKSLNKINYYKFENIDDSKYLTGLIMDKNDKVYKYYYDITNYDFGLVENNFDYAKITKNGNPKFEQVEVELIKNNDDVVSVNIKSEAELGN